MLWEAITKNDFLFSNAPYVVNRPTVPCRSEDSSSEDSNRARTLLRFQCYDEDSNQEGTLTDCGLYLRVYGIDRIV